MNTKTIVKLVSATFILSAGVAQAADWQPAGMGAEQVAVYVDAGSIREIDGGAVRITGLEDFSKVQYLGEPVYPHRSRETTFRVDCGSREVGYESWTLYEGQGGKGGVVWSDVAQDGVAMFRPQAGSAHARIMERACGAPVVAQR